MFKIGDFSRLTKVSVKTLHHYDDIGLFEPAHVDQWTSYRYYSFEQLPRLNRILALKELGFALEDIRSILDVALTTQQLSAVLATRQTELERQRTEIDEKLSRLAAHLQLIEQEGRMSDVQVILKRVETAWVAGARETVPQTQMREGCMALDKQVCAYIEKHGLKIAGPSLALYHDSSEAGVDVAMAYYIEAPQTAPGVEKGVYAHPMPAVETAACAIYHGSYDAFEKVREVYTTVGKWIEANGYKMAGAIREIYLQPPNWSTADRIGVMELQFPVEKA
jgi:DNA-binding transcriptional MerR regulator